MNRKVMLLLSGLAIILLLFIGYDCFIAFKPDIMFERSTIHLEEDYCFDSAGMIMFYNDKRPVPSSFYENQTAYVDWDNEIQDSFRLKEYIAPTNVELHAKYENGKVTFTYKGYVTTQEGETIDYFKEATFDFIVKPEFKNFDNVDE